MFRAWRLLDQILRGEATRPSRLEDGRLTFPVFGLTFVGLVLAVVYGACMGCYSLFRALDVAVALDYRQTAASMAKTPALFFLTLLITFPSLYVFNALVGSKLSFTSVWRLLIAALAVNLAVLASLGPIVAFFSLSTRGYGFMVLLNVAVFSLSGMLGLSFLVRTLSRLQRAQAVGDRIAAEAASMPVMLILDDAPTASPAQATALAQSSPAPTSASAMPAGGSTPIRPTNGPASSGARPGALEQLDRNGATGSVRVVFVVWIIVFSLVGAQMGWLLRPFVGHPDIEFQWLRPRQSNFFEAVGTTIWNTLEGTGKTDADPNAPPPDDRRGNVRSSR